MVPSERPSRRGGGGGKRGGHFSEITCYLLIFALKTLQCYVFCISHNDPCFQFIVAITNFFVSNTCEIRFHDGIGQSTVHMYSICKNPKP